MLKIVVEKWWKNKNQLENIFRTKVGWNSCTYLDLVKEIVNIILNDENDKWDIEHITEIDNGSYQGTLLYLIPENTYQPNESEYLMTYVGYGSCSGCDTLLSAQNWGDDLLDEEQIKAFMWLSLHILENMIKPYNSGWRNDEDWQQVDNWKF